MALYGAIKIAQLVFRYRKGLYKVLTAQDRAIGSAWKRGGYGRQAQYGARTGAAAGTLTAPFISNFAPDSPGNELQKPIQKRKQPTPRKPYKTRGGFPVRSGTRSTNQQYSYQNRRCPRPRKYF